MYDVTLTADEAPVQPSRVALTFPRQPEHCPVITLIMHKIDDEWCIAQGDVVFNDDSVTVITERLSEFALGVIVPVAAIPPIMTSSAVVDQEI